MERVFTFDQQGYTVTLTIWNEGISPEVVFDHHNVVDTYPLPLLQSKSGTEGRPYAIVSLLYGMGDNFKALRNRAFATGECIVALTAKIKGNRLETERSVKFKALQKLHWTNVAVAIDDKPHVWFPPVRDLKFVQLKLDETKKPVYKVVFM